jgi:apolipoprotein D and lipocalin family protein
MRPPLLLAAFLAVPALALASPAEPRKPLDLDRFMGRWYELLRIPNLAEYGCHAAHQDWSRVGDDRFMILETCHGDSDEGPQRKIHTPARELDPVTHNKFEATFFAGLIHRRYWVLDHADDYGWMIACTDDGKYASVMTRAPEVPAAELADLKARARRLGLEAGRLVFVGKGADD